MSESIKTFPELTTPRLFLRPLKNSDDEVLFTLRSNEQVNRYIERRKHLTIRETRKFIKMINTGFKKNSWLYWAICLKDRPELIGTICLWNFSDHRATAETGYELLPAFHGLGYMDEAVKIVVRYGFEKLSLNKLEAFTHRENRASIKLLEKNRFLIENGRRDLENSNNIVYSLAKKAWESSAFPTDPAQL
jgi:[ribosomal protein S5]-alanine N-acetyltransferase